MMEVGNHWKMRMSQLLQPQIVSYQSCSHVPVHSDISAYLYERAVLYKHTLPFASINLHTHTHIQKHYHL